MATVIRNDLQNSGLFRSIPPGSFIEQNLNANAPPRFPDWRSIGATGLVVGSITSAGGNLKVDFRLWDVIAGTQAAGLCFTSQPNNWRRLAHIISDAIYKRVTGEEGYFDTRVAYVSETGPLNGAGQAHRDHGPGRRQQPLHHRRRHASPSRRASRRRCRRSSTWRSARTRGRRASTCRTSTAAGASCWAISPA